MDIVDMVTADFSWLGQNNVLLECHDDDNGPPGVLQFLMVDLKFFIDQTAPTAYISGFPSCWENALAVLNSNLINKRFLDVAPYPSGAALINGK